MCRRERKKNKEKKECCAAAERFLFRQTKSFVWVQKKKTVDDYHGEWALRGKKTSVLRKTDWKKVLKNIVKRFKEKLLRSAGELGFIDFCFPFYCTHSNPDHVDCSILIECNFFAIKKPKIKNGGLQNNVFKTKDNEKSWKISGFGSAKVLWLLLLYMSQQPKKRSKV